VVFIHTISAVWQFIISQNCHRFQSLLGRNDMLGAGQISSSAPFCRINAAFQLLSERRIYAAGKISVVRPDMLCEASHDRINRATLSAPFSLLPSTFSFLHPIPH
jgi:hypothetical protein